MRWLLIALLPAPATGAEALVATRPIPAGTVLSIEDMAVVSAKIPGALTAADLALGQEARRAIAAGRPIMADDIAPPARVERNQIVPLHYAAGTLSIVTEGRALDQGAEGQVIAVMNLSSRSRVTGRVMADGSVHVAGGAP